MSVQDDIQRTRRLRARRLALVPPPSPVEPDPVETLLEDIRQALAALTEAVLDQPAPPESPTVIVEPTPVVINEKPGVSPDAIGKAVARHLPPPVESLTSEQLEKLLKAVANNVSYPIAGGGGTVGLRQKAITDLAAAINAGTGGLTDEELRATPVPVSGTIVTNEGTFTTATVVSVPSSITSVTLKAANTSRRRLWIHNNSTAVLYIKFGTGASASSFTVRLATQAVFTLDTAAYTGIITGAWASVNGNAQVTEVTP